MTDSVTSRNNLEIALLDAALAADIGNAGLAANLYLEMSDNVVAKINEECHDSDLPNMADAVYTIALSGVANYISDIKNRYRR